MDEVVSCQRKQCTREDGWLQYQKKPVAPACDKAWPFGSLKPAIFAFFSYRCLTFFDLLFRIFVDCLLHQPSQPPWKGSSHQFFTFSWKLPVLAFWRDRRQIWYEGMIGLKRHYRVRWWTGRAVLFGPYRSRAVTLEEQCLIQCLHNFTIFMKSWLRSCILPQCARRFKG